MIDQRISSPSVLQGARPVFREAQIDLGGVISADQFDQMAKQCITSHEEERFILLGTKNESARN